MRLFMILLGLVLLVGCAPTENQLRMEKDLEVMKRRLNQLEVEKVEATSTGSADGDALQRQMAELQAGLDNLRVEFQSVNGRLEDLGRDNQLLTDEMQMVKDDMGLQFSSLAAKVDEQQAQPVVQAPLKTEPEQVETAPEETAEQFYQRALDKVRKDEDYAQGRQLLEAFASQYPQHDLYVNALYWAGEALYGEKKYELAILQFQDVISKYASHPKAAAAMLKQALAFNALGDGENARTTMQKLIEEYPAAEQVEAAKKFLQQ